MLKLVVVLVAIASLNLVSGLKCYSCFDVPESDCSKNATSVDTSTCSDNTVCGTLSSTTVGIDWTYRGCVPENCAGLGTIVVEGITIDLGAATCSTCGDSLCNSGVTVNFTIALVLAALALIICL